MKKEIAINKNYKIYIHNEIINFFNNYDREFLGLEPIFVCIGEPTVPGDSVGPLVGDMLSSLGYTVYGTTHNPVNGCNANNIYMRLWIKTFLNRPIIAIDASLANASVGTIVCEVGKGINPGSGLGKKLHCIGNSAIRVITAIQPQELYSKNQDEMFAIAKCISASIHYEMQKRK